MLQGLKGLTTKKILSILCCETPRTYCIEGKGSEVLQILQYEAYFTMTEIDRLKGNTWIRRVTTHESRVIEVHLWLSSSLEDDTLIVLSLVPLSQKFCFQLLRPTPHNEHRIMESQVKCYSHHVDTAAIRGFFKKKSIISARECCFFSKNNTTIHLWPDHHIPFNTT